LTKRLGCLHAHHSNTGYIEAALSLYDLELIHFVDPGLMYRVSNDDRYRKEAAQIKVKEQLEWIAQCNVDAILITCTNYIALLQEEKLSLSVPIIKIDEPYFDYLCNLKQSQTIVFTNPATVQGTMERFHQFANRHQKSLDIEVAIINNAFELIMQDRKEEYIQEVSGFLNQMITNEKRVISVAQLSMVDAARKVEAETSKTIINPLNTLVDAIVNKLELP
jgi:glutamate racemase